MLVLQKILLFPLRLANSYYYSLLYHCMFLTMLALQKEDNSGLRFIHCDLAMFHKFVHVVQRFKDIQTALERK